MKNTNQQIEAQSLIININAMRRLIGVSEIDFNYLWKKSVEWLRNEQETTIQHYNEALKNKSN
jgi:hypothetical protein